MDTCQMHMQIFNDSELKECLADGTIGLPAADHLPNDDKDTPYFFLSDDAFGLRTYMMKPYSQRKMTTEQDQLQDIQDI